MERWIVGGLKNADRVHTGQKGFFFLTAQQVGGKGLEEVLCPICTTESIIKTHLIFEKPFGKSGRKISNTS